MKGSRVFFFAIIVLAFMGLYSGSEMYKHDAENGISRDIYNLTESKMVWNSSIFPMESYNASIHNDSNTIMYIRLNNIIYKIGDAMGFSLFEGTKIFMEIGYNTQGKYNLGFFLVLIKLVFWAVIIGAMFYPAMFIGMACYELFKWTRKFIKSRNSKGEENQNEDK